MEKNIPHKILVRNINQPTKLTLFASKTDCYAISINLFGFGKASSFFGKTNFKTPSS